MKISCIIIGFEYYFLLYLRFLYYVREVDVN